MSNKPVAWMFQGAFDISTYVSFEKPNPDIYPNPTPLYTQPHPDNLGLAESIIKQQELQIETLKAENKFFKDLMGDVEILKGKK